MKYPYNSSCITLVDTLSQPANINDTPQKCLGVIQSNFTRWRPSGLYLIGSLLRNGNVTPITKLLVSLKIRDHQPGLINP